MQLLFLVGLFCILPLWTVSRQLWFRDVEIGAFGDLECSGLGMMLAWAAVSPFCLLGCCGYAATKVVCFLLLSFSFMLILGSLLC